MRIAGSVSLRIDFARESQEVCDEVTAELGETSNVAILVEGAAVNIAQSTGTSSVSVRDQYVGQRTPLHATSSGKVLLAAAGDAVFDETSRHLRRFSDTTIVDPAALRDELQLVRERGWGSAVAEWHEHTNAIAVPVRATDGSVIGALSTTAPAFRLTPDEFPARAEVLRRFADELSRRLGHLVPARA
nr:IclR family transcriptional regulator [Pseudoclavibacter chungangensis]